MLRRRFRLLLRPGPRRRSNAQASLPSLRTRGWRLCLRECRPVKRHRRMPALA